MTVIEIAKQAGVSIGTVDRVLHNRGRVSPKTKQRVQTIIQEMGYQPNPLARQLKRNRKYRIGVLLPRQGRESGYWKLIYDGIINAANDFAAFPVQICLFDFIRSNCNSLVRKFNKMIQMKCDACIIAPIMPEEIHTLLSNLDSELTYAFIDSPLPGADPITTVAQDPFHGGYLAGKIMDLVSHSNGPFAVVRPHAKAYNQTERTRGFHTWFKGREGVELIDLVCPEKRTADIHNVIETALRKVPDLKGVFIVSSVGHKIADYIYGKGLKDNISIIAYDLVDDNVACLESGKIDCLISQRPEEQGRQVLHQIYRKIVLEEECISQFNMALDVYFKENLPCIRT